VDHATVGVGRDSQAGYTLLSDEPVIIEDLRSETRFRGPALLRDRAALSGMSVTIQGPEGPYGVLGVYTKERRTFTAEDVNFLRAVAHIISECIIRKAAEEALGQSEELYRRVVEQAAENIFLVDVETKRILQANAALPRTLGYTAEELQQLTLYDIVAQDRESVNRNTRRAVEEGQTFLGERQYRRKGGSLIDVEVSVSAIYYKGKEVLAIVAHDVTQRKRVEDRLRCSLEELLALYEAGHVLGSTLESEELGSRLLEIVRRVSKLTTAVISRPDEHRQLRVWRAVGLDNLRTGIRSTPEVQDMLHTVLESGNQGLIRLKHHENDGETWVGLCLPLLIKTRSVGLLEVYGPESLLQEDTVGALDSLANQAASALENAELYGELAEREKQLENLVGKLIATQEEERRRVAYEVHDSVAQTAAAAHQRLQTFTRRHAPASESEENDLGQVRSLVRQTVTEARRIIAALRPEVLDDFGLPAALYQEVEELRGKGWQVDYLEELGEERLPVAIEVALFRVAQEALTNARKHAQTCRALIELRRQNGLVSLEIRDWGRGFDPDALNTREGPGEWVGISGMRERIGMLGGEFELRSRLGEGTSIRVQVSLPAFGEDDQEEDKS
jgi:PAS domain S-box-containing protein